MGQNQIVEFLIHDLVSYHLLISADRFARMNIHRVSSLDFAFSLQRQGMVFLISVSLLLPTSTINFCQFIPSSLNLPLRMHSFIKRELISALETPTTIQPSTIALQRPANQAPVTVEYQGEEEVADWPSSDQPSLNRLCTICGAPSNGYHFSAASCSACAAFFRRTVTLNRNFTCNQHNQCRVNYAMRVICRACRYTKCIAMGMQRSAVQPRRDCNVGRRKISYRTFSLVSQTRQSPTITPLPISQRQPSSSVAQPLQLDTSAPGTSNSYAGSPMGLQTGHTGQEMDGLAVAMDHSGLSPEELGYAASYSSSISEDYPPDAVAAATTLLQSQASPSVGLLQPPSDCSIGASTLKAMLREEMLFNERRKLLYCSKSSLTKLMSNLECLDIPFSSEDIIELTFDGVQKTIRPHILLVYEWMRGWPYFERLNSNMKIKWLRRCILYHAIIDPSYLTVRLGLHSNRFVMFNGMFVGIDENSQEGWRDEACISAEMKKKLYRPLLERAMNEIVLPMDALKLSFEEYIVLKALLSFKGAAMSLDFPEEPRQLMTAYCDCVLKALHYHYTTINMDAEQVAQRTGNLVLLMSSIFSVGHECLESHQKIQFFDLWELDELLQRLISPRL